MNDPGLPEQQAAGVPSEGRRPPLVSGSWTAWLASLAPWSATLFLLGLARSAPAVVEASYSRGAYPQLSWLLSQVSGAWAALTGSAFRDGVSPSLSELCLLGLPVAAFRVLRGGWRRGGLAAVARQALALSGGGALLFLLLWGLNYSRLPLATSLGLEVTGVSATELDGVAAELEAQLSVEFSAGWEARLGVSPEAALREALLAWEEAVERQPVLGRGGGVVVRPALSGGLVRAGISGIFSPFTQEAHVAGHLPAPDLLFTACHELAHARGWAREDEANYLAWRVGSRATSSELRAAARLLTLGHVLAALGRADRGALVARLEGMDPQVEAAMVARARFWDRERSRTASRAASAVNDAYLRSQGQEGVASYGRMVDLLVAEWRAGGGALPAGDPR